MSKKVPLSSRQIYALASIAYGESLTLAQSFFNGHHGCYRVGIVGNTRLQPGHLLLQQGYRFGQELAKLGIDIVISSAEENSFPGRAALGYRDFLKSGRGGQIICTLGPSAGNELPWLGNGPNIQYYPQKYAPFEFLSGFISDLVGVVPSLDSHAEILELWQRAQLCMKIAMKVGLEKVPLGLRLRNSAVIAGWEPEAICVGPQWNYLMQQRDTYLNEGTISAERDEGRFLNFQVDIDAALDRILNRALHWAETVPACQDNHGTQFPILTATLLRKVRKAQTKYVGLMRKLVPKEQGYYRTAYFGSHFLPPGHPALAQAYEMGYFLGYEGYDLLEGSAGETSVMGQAAMGHRAGRESSQSNAWSQGISLKLPWEAAEATSGMRNRVIVRDALAPRVDTFLALLTASVADEGGVGTGLEEAILLKTVSDVHRALARNEKVSAEALISRSIQKGWRPKQWAIGPSSRWEWRRSLNETLLIWGALDPKKGEDQILRFSPDPDHLKHQLRVDREEWRGFVSRHGLPIRN